MSHVTSPAAVGYRRSNVREVLAGGKDAPVAINSFRTAIIEAAVDCQGFQRIKLHGQRPAGEQPRDVFIRATTALAALRYQL
ncbi:hypothetical protein [Bradyrhizobium sp.]|uniref:hypothetical protein n=1 Tax=Bradyrhizobium sp. TaxID=376 RepID=UPI003C4BE5E8